MSGDCFLCVDVTRFRQSLAELHQRVAAGCGRVEITHKSSSHACVLISKAELESLEQALEILARTADYQGMCAEVSRVALDCGGMPPCAAT